MAPEQDGFLLQIVSELADAVVFEERLQPPQYGRQELINKMA